MLTAVDGETITYNAIGNPTSYYNGTSWSFGWKRGCQFATASNGTDIISYSYDANGMRTGKTVVTRTYEENHTHVYSAQIVSPTCTQQGYTLHTCACGASYKDTYVAALGHTITSGRCIRCGYVGGITPPITPPGGSEIMSLSQGETAAVQSTTTRVLKSTRTENYQYVYNGGTLSQMTLTITNDNGTPTVYTFNYQYDASGTPMSMVINGSEKLYYVTNLQGDVVALLNEDGDEVATYSYSAYGEMDSEYVLYSAETVMASIYGAHLYRGYVHDIETGWYYLQSRFYNPEVGRFINADIYASTGQGLVGNNMFAYCLNNPVIHKDSYGTDAVVVLDEDFPGHIGVLVQDTEGNWWHFYWGADASKSWGINYIICAFAITVKPTSWCVEFLGDASSLEEINNSGQYSGTYESMVYLEGDFSECLDFFKNPIGPYHLYANNCSQVSLRTLSFADTSYSEILWEASLEFLPETAMSRIEWRLRMGTGLKEALADCG